MTLDTETRTDPRRKRASIKLTTRSAAAPATTITPEATAIPGRRNPKWIALGVVALCLGGLLSYVIYASVATQTAVVAVATTVYRGETLDATDLTTVTIGSVAAGVQTVPAAELDGLIGQKAVYDLVAGSILPAGAVAKVTAPAAGRAVVGVRMASGRAPLGLLTPGSPVRLVAIPPTGADPTSKDPYTGKTFLGRVVSQVNGVDGNSVVVNVDVLAAQAPAVASLGAQERLALVRDSER
jgi:flagella basal body P-ring formation protein FlgA